MPRGKAQQDGIDYEHKFAKVFGVEPVKGSGNQWYVKLDVGVRQLVCSLKHTGKSSLTVTRAILAEALQYAGRKGSIGIVAVDIAGEDFVIIRTDDFAALLEEDEGFVPVPKNEQKRRRASIPEILREEDG